MSTNPEDILSSSLQSLYSHTPVTFSSPGSLFTHRSSGVTVLSPDPAPSNWNLHASSLWIGSLFLANHLDEVPMNFPASHVYVLELGASTGFPGILFAKRHPDRVRMTLSDYPDDNILRTLKENVERNTLPSSLVRVVGHAWGDSTDAFGEFDIILAADTIWNPEMHLPFIQTLSRVLRRHELARAYLVAGLHTGRWVIHRFLEKLAAADLFIEGIVERMVDIGHESGRSEGSCERQWSVERDGEDENDRRKWIVWIVIKWRELI